jgi:flagellar basal-body rod protein FlgB
MMGMFRTSTVPALEQTVAFAQRRHEVLAGNLANLDTPGYRTRDLSVADFQNALADSIEAAQHPSPGHATAVPGTGSPATRGDFMEGPRHAMEQVVFHDNSDVGLESQVTEMAKNQHLHNSAIALMRSQFGLLRAAISERA